MLWNHEGLQPRLKADLGLLLNSFFTFFALMTYRDIVKRLKTAYIGQSADKI